MDCNYMNQRPSCNRCSPMMKPAADMNCGCGMPPTMIPDRPQIQPRMPERPMPVLSECKMGGNMMPGNMMPSYPPPMPINKKCDCPDTRPGCLERYPVAMGYVPWQQWQETYCLERGLRRGTIFPDLDLPFVMGRCR